MREMLVRNEQHVPDYMLEPETLPNYLFYYWLAFWDLDTCRYDAQGAIPFSEVLRYAAAFDITSEPDVEEFVAYIRALDRTLQRLRIEDMNSSTSGAQGAPPPDKTRQQPPGARINGPSRRNDTSRT